ncbi:hypothetical protein K470DRAFT_256626 [Piedraia hortae CBS 480.64]|uniref:Uncharacterized protein n=1 Tax=Piedraia hortae CBS 480.64 TaxID=1314780 RepID=A0A6A7C2P9_9PEZI|nr:hypothetical protein K470DRAFT_256626 [Piedraia hortae CBS 480.64]
MRSLLFIIPALSIGALAQSDDEYTSYANVLYTAMPESLRKLATSDEEAAISEIAAEFTASTVTGIPSWFTHMPTAVQEDLVPGILDYESTHSFAKATGASTSNGGKKSSSAPTMRFIGAVSAGVAVAVGVGGVLVL